MPGSRLLQGVVTSWKYTHRVRCRRFRRRWPCCAAGRWPPTAAPGRGRGSVRAPAGRRPALLVTAAPMRRPPSAVSVISREVSADVDEPLGRRDAEPEVVDQVGAAGEEDRGRVAGDVAHGLGDAARAGVGEGLHACTPPACWMAGTIVAQGAAAGGSRSSARPLRRGRARDRRSGRPQWLGQPRSTSPSMPTAEQILPECSSRTGRRPGRGRPSTGCSCPSVARPSAVVSSAPSWATASARTAPADRPAARHAPHWPVAALLRAGVAQPFAERVQQRGAGVDRQPVALPVDPQGDLGVHSRTVPRVPGRGKPGTVRRDQSAGSSTQSGPLTSPGPPGRRRRRSCTRSPAQRGSAAWAAYSLSRVSRLTTV